MGALARTIAGLVTFVAVASLTSHYHFSGLAEAAGDRIDAALGKDLLTAQELREDIADLERLLRDVHPTAIPSLPFDDPGPALDELSVAIDGPLAHLAFYRLLAPVANRLNDEHTMVFPSEVDRAGLGGPDASRLPLDVALIDDRLYVAANRSDTASIRPGDEILSINGHTTGQIFDTLSRYYSGTREEQKRFYAAEDFHAALPLVLDISGPYRVEIRSRETGTVIPQELPDIRSADDVAEDFSFVLLSPNAMLFTWRAFEDEASRFDEFLASMFAHARAENVRSLIIDIRSNRGGAALYGDAVIEYLTDSPFSQLQRVEVRVSEDVRAEFLGYVPAALRWLPIQYLHPWLRPLWINDVGDSAAIRMDPVVPSDDVPRFSGVVYLLVGPGTMSSASLFAATLKHHALATIVGEDTGGHATMYGNIIDARLPNSGLRVWMPTSIVAGLAVGPVTPDYIVTRNADDLAAGKDTVLEYVLALAAGGSAR